MIPLRLAADDFETAETMPIAPGWSGDGLGQPRYRIDGYAKVTGAKIYARDFRAADMEGWPDENSHAMLLFAGDATHRFTGIDLTVLGDGLKPNRVVTADEVEAAGIRGAGFFAETLYCKRGDTPDYLGQVVALLIYDQFEVFIQARQMLRGAPGVVVFGDETGPAGGEPYGANRFTRVGGSDPSGPDVYSPMKDGWVTPVRYRKGEQPVWPESVMRADAPGLAELHGREIRQGLADGTEHRTFNQSFEIPAHDHVFMEPESGLAYYDAARRTLSLVVGSQAPLDTLKAIAAVIAGAEPARKVSDIDGYFPYIGGGFGGKALSLLPLHVAIAGLFNDGRPVRLALDRFEQFQFGLKRHATTIDSQLSVDPKTGKFSAFACDLSLNGGGTANYSVNVADVSAVSAASCYYLPKSDVTTVALRSRAVTAGSMRGFGALQSIVAMECLIDQAAGDLQLDPIALRRTNALLPGQHTVTGASADQIPRNLAVLDAIESSALWADREETRRNFEADNPLQAYGVGVASSMFKFGTGEDGTLGAVSFDREGHIAVTASSVEMGTGASTAVAVRVADRLGRNADIVRLDSTGPFWDPLGLVTSGNAWTMTQAEQNRSAVNPRWVPVITSRSSASISAYVASHAVDKAAYGLLLFSLWPAARAIWRSGSDTDRDVAESLDVDALTWSDGMLSGGAARPLAFAELAAKVHDMGLATGVMVHCYNRWRWSTATFPVDGGTWSDEIDALALERGGTWAVHDRTVVDFPPAVFERVGAGYFSGCGAVAALSVGRIDGQVKVLSVHEVLDCGRILVPAIVSGISEGGIAMGIGHALSEYLPLYEDGPGNGTWNLNRYNVARAADVPIWNMSIETLPAEQSDLLRGMAEIVTIPVISAIVNAIHDATGKRFTRLPVTADDIVKAMQA